MDVSVIITVYDVPVELLRACFASVELQSLRDDQLEVVVVDDCSTNAEVVRIISDRVERLGWRHVRHERNLGPNAARRSGARAARGRYVVYVDGDDALTRDAAELLLIRAQQTDADFVTAPQYRWNSRTLSYDVRSSTARPLANSRRARLGQLFSGAHSFTMCGRLIRRDLLDDDVFDMPDRLLHEDLISSARIAAKATRVAHIAEAVYYYTITAGSITRNFASGHVEGVVLAIDSWMQLARRVEPGREVAAVAPAVDRLLDTVVTRCLTSGDMTLDEQVDVLSRLREHIDNHGLDFGSQPQPGTHVVVNLDLQDRNVTNRLIQRASENLEVRDTDQSDQRLDRGIGPSSMALRLKDKVVFIAQVDYQVRNAAGLAAEMRRRGYPCVVLDNSAVVADGRRRFVRDDPSLFNRIEHIAVDRLPYPPDWLSTARLVVTFNDFNLDFREALEYRHRLELPTACMVEGISDFLRIDFDEPRVLPYRRCDHVLLAGPADEEFFGDRDTYTVGPPIIEQLAEGPPASFPEVPLAVLNVNFTYGCLEDRRDAFVRSAAAAFRAAGVDWTITQHPMDAGDLTGYPSSDRSQYELIEDCTVFVSRFATGILEALARGKPAIYYNPHGERVRKYQEPMGAFRVATNVDELVEAVVATLRDIGDGVDFRAGADEFLRWHTSLRRDDAANTCGTRFADAARQILAKPGNAHVKAAAHLVERLGVLDPDASYVLGGFGREHGAQMNEEELVSRMLTAEHGLMIDVGANFGNGLDVFLGRDWDVHAFEPDPENRARLLELWPGSTRLTVRSEAVSDEDGRVLPFYASDESTGISSLSAFTEGHRLVAEVRTITLRTYLEQAGVEHVDFLKIDVEGHDKFVLDGFDWESDRPDVLLAEYEDFKTQPLGYDAHELARTMIAQGYSVYVSEWHPVVRYGIAHDWKSVEPYDPSIDLSQGWGNLIGFREDPGHQALLDAALLNLRFFPPARREAVVRSEAATAPMEEPRRRWYAGTADRLRSLAPRQYEMLRRWRRAMANRGQRSRQYLSREFRNGFREGCPTLFRLLQLPVWAIRWCRRHLAWTTTWTLALLAVVVVSRSDGVAGDVATVLAWVIAGVFGAVLVGDLARDAIGRWLDARDAALAARISSRVHEQVREPDLSATTSALSVLSRRLQAVDEQIVAVRADLARHQRSASRDTEVSGEPYPGQRVGRGAAREPTAERSIPSERRAGGADS